MNGSVVQVHHGSILANLRFRAKLGIKTGFHQIDRLYFNFKSLPINFSAPDKALLFRFILTKSEFHAIIPNRRSNLLISQYLE